MSPPRFTEAEREASFMSKVKIDKRSGCWMWQGTKQKNGYGRFGFGGVGGSGFAHRWAYLHWVGAVPEGMEVDHACHNRSRRCKGGNDCRHRACVNPEHLVLATRRQNVRRGKSEVARRARKTRCVRGHPLSGKNVYIDKRGRRVCRACVRWWNRTTYEKKVFKQRGLYK